jgi:RNA ligase
MKPISQIVEKNTGWKKSELIEFAKQNRVEVRQEGNLMLLNYEEDIPNLAWNDFNRQCRGLILDIAQKTLVAHPYDKFFPLDSHPDTQFNTLPLSSGYEIAIKYDGTMITTFSYKNVIRFATRSAFDNTQIKMAQQLYNKRYPQLKQIDLSQYTLIFELVSPQNRIIVSYDESDLILLCVRKLVNNHLLSYSQTIEFAKRYDLKPVSLLQQDFMSVLKIAKEGSNHAIEEGWVIRFGNGLYVKLKTWQYIAYWHIQRRGLTKKRLTNRYCQMSLKEWSEFLESLPPVFREAVEQFGQDLQARIDLFSEKIYEEYEKFSQIESQKAFAMTIKKEVPQEWHSFFFALRSGKALEPLIRRKFQKEDLSAEVVIPLSMIREWAFNQKDAS